MSRGYRLFERASLAARNTFRVPAAAALFAKVDDAAALPALLSASEAHRRDLLVLGEGSNLLLVDDVPGLVLSLRASAVRVVEDNGDAALLRIDAGMDWDALVRRTLALGLAGLENLALIPGTVGAAPIQNIGAYGAEIGESVACVEALDRERMAFVRLSREDCGFAYRDSVFKREPERWIVTAVELRLRRSAPLRLDYAGIREELAAMHIDAPRTADVADAVTRLRRRKLPDPAVIGNAGSFFKNPIVETAQAETLRAAHPGLPVFPAGDSAQRKLSAAWLIDTCGWKGHRDGDAGVSDKHALVLVNHGAATGAQLLALARRIAASVRERFAVALEPEPRIVGARW